MNCGCKEHKKHKCGEFKGNETKEEKIKHLKECKEGLLSKIEEIDTALTELES